MEFEPSGGGPGSVLVLHPGSLGDVLLARRALRALKTGQFRRELLLVANGEVGHLLKDCGEVHRTIPLEHQDVADVFSGRAWTRTTVGVIAGRCELAVCWMSDPSGEHHRALERAGVSSVIVRSPHELDGRSIHQEERFLNTVASVTRASCESGPLRLPAGVLEAGRVRLEAAGLSDGRLRVVVHPGSGSRHKCCSPAFLADVIVSLHRGGMTPVLLSGPVDHAVTASLQTLLPFRPLLLEGLDLQSVAGVLAAADLYVGHDSGITHLAAAVGVPALALFGPTEASRWAPRGKTVLTISGEPCRCQGWEEVRACREKMCLRIPPERVVAACRRLVSRGEQEPCAEPSA